MLGKYKIIVEIFYFIANFGIIISCILTFNDFMTGIFESQNQNYPSLSKKKSLFWVVLPNLLLYPILTRKSIADIKNYSLIAVISVFLLAFYTLWLFGISEKIKY